MRDRILFLSWESPWPAFSGAGIRRWGLLSELGRDYPVDLLVLSRKPLTKEQTAKLGEIAHTVTRIPLKDVTAADKARALARMIVHRLPYHGAVLESSLGDHPDFRQRIEEYPGIVFTSVGHWGMLIRYRRAAHWILNQCDADVDYWRVHALQAEGPLEKAAARINHRLSLHVFRRVYRNAGRIISVCEEDRHLTRELAPEAQIDVIENGVDCSYYVPDHDGLDRQPPRLLFTGTSAVRNVTALRWFAGMVLPLIRKQIPDVELLIGGDFDPKTRDLFNRIRNIRFTGRVDDIRPCFNQSHVYVAPFRITHGTRVKIAEAMAMGMAIVSKPGGIRGYPLVDGESVLVAETPEAFADCCLKLLRDASLREKLERAARQIALKALDWKILGERLRAIVKEHRTSLDGISRPVSR